MPLIDPRDGMIPLVRLRLKRPPTNKPDRAYKEAVLVGLGLARRHGKSTKWKLGTTVILHQGQSISISSIEGAIIAVKSLVQLEFLDRNGIVVSAARQPNEIEELAPSLHRWIRSGAR